MAGVPAELLPCKGRAELSRKSNPSACLQASDFVPTPLAEDQGAITRFFNGNQPQKAGERTVCVPQLPSSRSCWCHALAAV